MMTAFARTVILYFLIMTGLRLMGKRQIGELEPGELVLTMMISDLATVPMQDFGIPLLAGVIPILTLLALSMLLSQLSLTSLRFRRLACGAPSILIREGVLQQEVMRKNRYTLDELLEELLSGKVLVALMGPGHFTNRGHFILLRGVTLSGQVLVADPNSAERSLSVWDPQLILDELSKSTNNGAPLWSIAQPETPTGVPSSF